MRCLTKPLTAAMAIAVLLFGGTAWAGVHDPQEVTINENKFLGPYRAEGTLLGARSSSNRFQVIGCQVTSTQANDPFYLVTCVADNGWSRLYCYSYEEAYVRNAMSISDYDSVRFTVKNGQCTSLTVGSYSDNLP